MIFLEMTCDASEKCQYQFVWLTFMSKAIFLRNIEYDNMDFRAHVLLSVNLVSVSMYLFMYVGFIYVRRFFNVLKLKVQKACKRQALSTGEFGFLRLQPHFIRFLYSQELQTYITLSMSQLITLWCD